MKCVQFSERKKGWSRDSRCLWSIFGRDEHERIGGRQEKALEFTVVSKLVLESTERINRLVLISISDLYEYRVQNAPHEHKL